MFKIIDVEIEKLGYKQLNGEQVLKQLETKYQTYINQDTHLKNEKEDAILKAINKDLRDLRKEIKEIISNSDRLLRVFRFTIENVSTAENVFYAYLFNVKYGDYIDLIHSIYSNNKLFNQSVDNVKSIVLLFKKYDQRLQELATKAKENKE